MDPKAFYDQFASRITVALNWQLLLDQQLPIESRLIESRHALGNLGLPWYLDADGASCNVDVLGARRLTVSEAATLLDGTLKHQLDTVEEKVDEVEPGSTVALPAYSRGGAPILLDGCHRSLALMRATGKIAVKLCVIAGPDDTLLLADLHVPDP